MLDNLQNEGVITTDDITTLRTSHKSLLESHLAQVESHTPTADMLQRKWEGMVWPASVDAVRDPDTGVDAHTLREVGAASVQVPDGFVSMTASVWDRVFAGC